VSPAEASLFEHATRLHELDPDAPLPRGGRPLPDERPNRESGHFRPYDSRTLRAAFDRFFGDPTTPVQFLHDTFCRIRVSPGMLIVPEADPWPEHDPDRGRAAGLWLVRRGTDRRPVDAGLALLIRNARPEDGVVLRTIGLLDEFTNYAVMALEKLPDASEHLAWLAERTKHRAWTTVVRPLLDRGDPAAIAWRRRHGLENVDRAALGRQVERERVLALHVDEPDADLTDDGVTLLGLVAPGPYRLTPDRYPEARRALDALVRSLPHSRLVPNHSLVAFLFEGFRSGHVACLGWEPGHREELQSLLHTTLRGPDITGYLDGEIRFGAHKGWAEWVPRIAEEVPPGRFRIHVVVPGYVEARDVQTRILVDGWPVIAAAFDKDVPEPPDTLLGQGLLRVRTEPHEVRLTCANPDGALWVTIARDGDDVVWRGWRGYTSAEPPPELRIRADEYDAELARAESDDSWRAVVEPKPEHAWRRTGR
jgi:hypothetical protein